MPVGPYLAYFAPGVKGGSECFWWPAALAAVLTAIFASTQAQDCARCAPPLTLDAPVPAPEWTIRKQVNEVNVSFVAGRHGKFAGDLTLEDITVLDDNKPPAAILGFRTEPELPLRAGILIDTSSSVTPRLRFEQAAPRRLP